MQLSLFLNLLLNLGINVPTGKDSLSMKQKYPEGDVISPGTVIISAAGNCNAISKVVEPLFKANAGSIYYINISQDAFKLGGSAFGQVLNKIGNETPNVKSASYLKNVFNTLQDLIKKDKIVAGHDVASGGLITTLLELCFSENNLGADLNFNVINELDSIKLLFAENSGIVFQSTDDSIELDLFEASIEYYKIGNVTTQPNLNIINGINEFSLDIAELRDVWYETSFLLDQKQTANGLGTKQI